jgi:alkylated DNA nucleotide flippase Atl1
MIDVVQRIPFGKVTNYGEIATIVSDIVWHMISAQMIGRQLSGLVNGWDDVVPWRRVVNKQWFVSTLKKWDKWWRQIAALESEEIPVVDWYVDVRTYWVSASVLSTRA